MLLLLALLCHQLFETLFFRDNLYQLHAVTLMQPMNLLK